MYMYCSLTGFQEIGRRKEERGVGPDEGQVRSEYTRDRQEVSEGRRVCVKLRDVWFVCEWTATAQLLLWNSQQLPITVVTGATDILCNYGMILNFSDVNTCTLGNKSIKFCLLNL